MKQYCIVICCFLLNGCMERLPQQEKKEPTSTIGIMGDVMIGRLVSDVITQKGFTYIWGTMLPLLRSNDINLINLETTLTHSIHMVPKVFNFKSHPHNVQSLKEGSITIVNIANNHILDFSVEGLIDTISILDNAGIYHVGAGMSLDDATKPSIIERNGIRIGIIGATDNEPTWAATENNPGTNYIPLEKCDVLTKQIKALRPYVDCLIVSIHWGSNWPSKPSDEMRHCAHVWIDAGADIIHGHSAHITLGIETYTNKLIIYSAGDFIDDYMVGPEERNDHTILFQVTINKQGITHVKLIPGIIHNMQIQRAYGDQALQILKRMQQLSQELFTQSIMEDETLIIPIRGK